MSQTSPEKPIGTTMYILAWAVLFGLMAVGFSDWLASEKNPNQSPDSRLVNGGRELTLRPNRQHHYLSRGTINGQDVTFLLDTGATQVAVPLNLAKQLALKPGRKHYVNTANGTATAYSTQIDSLSIGEIKLYDLKASLNPGMQGEIILLGMNALKQLEFSQKGELLILRQ